jgi:hypothetical protein
MLPQRGAGPTEAGNHCLEAVRDGRVERVAGERDDQTLKLTGVVLRCSESARPQRMPCIWARILLTLADWSARLHIARNTA